MPRRAKDSNQPKTPKAPPSKKYEVHTSPEADAILRAAADGKTQKDWFSIHEAGLHVHQTKGARHRVQIATMEGETLAVLETATITHDADCIMVLLYISKCLLPIQPISDTTRAAATINLDEVIRAIGWVPQTTNERAEMRRRVWRFIKWASRAHIVGDRSYTIRDELTGKKSEITTDAPAWMLGQRDRQAPPVQASLFPDDEEPPLSVEIVATQMWTRVTSAPSVAQFLPCGEILGAIPGSQPSGAWARVIGVALTNFWRRNPERVLDGSLMPTRRELLERYTPTTGSVQDILSGPKPPRAIQYWAQALKILVECEFLANEGEAALDYEEHRKATPLRHWQESWLNGHVNLKPGPALQHTLKERANKLPPVPANSTRKSGAAKKLSDGNKKLSDRST